MFPNTLWRSATTAFRQTFGKTEIKVTNMIPPPRGSPLGDQGWVLPIGILIQRGALPLVFSRRQYLIGWLVEFFVNMPYEWTLLLNVIFISQNDFPAACPGGLPFNASYFRESYLKIQICSPGNLSAVPCTVNRDRQDIKEDLYVNVLVFPPEAYIDIPSVVILTNFTIHCKARSTRGYFELGFHQNDYTPGPLLQSWPEETDLAANFNENLGLLLQYSIPSKA